MKQITYRDLPNSIKCFVFYLWCKIYIFLFCLLIIYIYLCNIKIDFKTKSNYTSISKKYENNTRV